MITPTQNTEKDHWKVSCISVTLCITIFHIIILFICYICLASLLHEDTKFGHSAVTESSIVRATKNNVVAEVIEKQCK